MSLRWPAANLAGAIRSLGEAAAMAGRHAGRIHLDRRRVRNAVLRSLAACAEPLRDPEDDEVARRRRDAALREPLRWED